MSWKEYLKEYKDVTDKFSLGDWVIVTKTHKGGTPQGKHKTVPKGTWGIIDDIDRTLSTVWVKIKIDDFKSKKEVELQLDGDSIRLLTHKEKMRINKAKGLLIK